MNTIISLLSHTWTVLLQQQEQEKKLELRQELDQDQEQYKLRVTLCSIHIQTRYILANFFKNIFFFSFLWRTFLILYGEGFIRNGMINIRLFEQLFWIITIALISITYGVFPGKMLVKGTFPKLSKIGLCLLQPVDVKLSRDTHKLSGVVLASGFIMIFFVIYLTWRSKRLLKSKTSLIGRFRRNAIGYQESAAISVVGNFFNFFEITMGFVYRFFNFSPSVIFWIDSFLWIFLFEISALAFTFLVSFRHIPSD